MSRIHPLSVRQHSFKARRISKEFTRKLRRENKHLKMLLKQCGEMFVILRYRKRTADLRSEIEQVLKPQESKDEI